MKRKGIALLFVLVYLFVLPIGFGIAEKEYDELNGDQGEKVNQPIVEGDEPSTIIMITIMVLFIGALTRVWVVVYKKRRRNQ